MIARIHFTHALRCTGKYQISFLQREISRYKVDNVFKREKQVRSVALLNFAVIDIQSEVLVI